MKLAKILDLKYLAKQIECKLKIVLSRYYEAFQSLNLQCEDQFSNNDIDTFYDPNIIDNAQNNNFQFQSNEYKGLFFLPNGNPILILDENLNQEILKNSVIINYNENKMNRNTNLKKTSQEQKDSFKSGKILKNQMKYFGTPILNPPQESFINNLNKSANLEENLLLPNISQIISNEENVNNSLIMNANNISLTSNKFMNDNENILLTDIKNEFNLSEFLVKHNLINFESVLYENDNTPSEKPLGYDLLKYFNKQEVSDVILNVQNQLIYCNKIILVSKSKYFENMFSENLKENTDNKVNISDYSYEELILVNLFMYCDCLNLDFNLALELMKGADRFAIESLKQRLENYISSKLDVGNAAKIYKYSCYYNCEKLKKISLYYINDFYKQVIETEEFEDLDREFMLEIVRFCKTK